ncbi:MAG TPA: hypothetical protein VJP77_05340, partial [Planctomycetota bacterium]|nr:hypothetical protein [Planctomycetota bacterium]
MHRALLLAAVAALVPLAALLSLGGCASGGGGKLADVLGAWVLAELTGTDLAAYDAVVEARPELEL